MIRGPIAIVLVGPRFLIREGIARILVPGNFRIVASASSIGEVALSSLSQHESILLMIDASDDLEAAIVQIEQFKIHHPAGRVAVINDRSRPSDMITALRAGANAYLANIENCDAFIKSLEVVMLGETLLWSASLPHILEQSGGAADGAKGAKVLSASENSRRLRLSERQEFILRCLAEGATNRVIASKIDVEEATVKVHVRTVLQKIRARNRTQAAVWALNNGLTPKKIGSANDGSDWRSQN
jgi:DNA-binding NarL/FixJ family response regulator